MAAAVDVQGGFTTAEIRRMARESGDAKQVRRLLALSAIYTGGTRSVAAQIGGVDLQTLRDWVLQDLDSLIDGKAPGRQPLLDADKCEALAADRERPVF